MDATVEIDKAGRIVVPKKMRDALHLVPGTRVTLRQENEAITLQPEPGTRGLRWKNGMLVYDHGHPLPPDSVDWVQQAREERDEMLRTKWQKND